MTWSPCPAICLYPPPHTPLQLDPEALAPVTFGSEVTWLGGWGAGRLTWEAPFRPPSAVPFCPYWAFTVFPWCVQFFPSHLELTAMSAGTLYFDEHKASYISIKVILGDGGPKL